MARRTVRFGVIVFPGSNCDYDTYETIETFPEASATYLWHKETVNGGFDCLVLPGGFAHGDYLRTGAIARFSPIMESVRRFAEQGRLVIGICNGFQILLESQLLPGAMVRNNCLRFVCRSVHLRVENLRTPFSSAFDTDVVRMPIAHGEGNYYIDKEGLRRLETKGQIVFRYCSENGTLSPDANPNGSVGSVAGICNERGNVLGMMPHPERCSDPLLGGTDGRNVFRSIIDTVLGRSVGRIRSRGKAPTQRSRKPRGHA